MRRIANAAHQLTERFVQRRCLLLQRSDPLAHFAHLVLSRAGVVTFLLQLADLFGSGIPLRHQLLRIVERGAALDVECAEQIQVKHEAAVGHPLGDAVPMVSEER